ncbi:MAG: S-formylglutathione hydrolase [Parvularculaceae bacterium]
MRVLNERKCFGGVQGFYAHASKATGTEMSFGLFLPPQIRDGPVPVLIYLAGLESTHETAAIKAGAQRALAARGVAMLTPDTSPRGLDLPGEHDDWDFGSGAGFYLDAVETPWADHYRMRAYVLGDLIDDAARAFPALDASRLAVTGHSMGGHGALTLALSSPGRFKSVSAFAPIVAPAASPWGQKAFARYLGEDRAAWRAYDACSLIEDGARAPHILIDQGAADAFLDGQLMPARLEKACADAGQELTLRRQAGYDHSYFFVSSFIDDHVAWAAERM